MNGEERNIGKMILFHVWWYLQVCRMPCLSRDQAIDIVKQKIIELSRQ